MVTATATRPEKPITFYDLAPSPGTCPYAQRSKIVLKEKDLPYEQKLIDKANKPQDFLDLFRSITSNPNGRGTVPTIIDGDVKLTESHVVSEYLDTAYPNAGPKLFPTDAKKIALVRLFIEVYVSEVHSHTFKALFAEDRETLDSALEGFTKGLKVIDGFLKDHKLEGGEFLLGNEFSYAEVATVPFVHRAFVLLPALRKFDVWAVIKENGLQHLHRWSEAGLGRSSVKDTVPPDQLTIELFDKMVKVKDIK